MDTRFYRDNAPWLAAAGLMTFASSFGQTFYIALSAGGIRAEFGLSDGAWGGLYTLATLASAAVLVQAGGLADRIALPRMILGVAVLYLAAIALMATAESVLMLGLAVFGLRLAGQGLISHLGQVATARWFRANRGRAMAVVVLGYPLGEAILPPLAVALIAAIGWRASWGVAAAILALLLVPAILALLARGERRPAGAPSGEGAGHDAPGMGGRHWTRGEVLSHWSFWALMPAVLTPGFIGTVLFFHQVHVAETRGWDLATMAAGYPVYAAVSVALSLASGPVIDRLGPVRFLPVFLMPIVAASLILAIPGSEVVWLGVLLAVGVSQGVVVTLFGTLWATLYGTRALGGIKALAVSGSVLATAIGPGITGLAIDLGYPLTVQGPAMAAGALAAAAACTLATPRLLAGLATPAPIQPEAR
ncbi:MAG: MFS transporter [Pseudomonadota bacterium]